MANQIHKELEKNSRPFQISYFALCYPQILLTHPLVSTTHIPSWCRSSSCWNAR